MSVTDENLERAAEALYTSFCYSERDRGWTTLFEETRERYRRRAQQTIDAYKKPPAPKWPTEETMDALCRAASQRGAFLDGKGACRAAMADALREHDPIIQAAIAVRDYFSSDMTIVPAFVTEKLIVAVNEAGL